MTTPDWTEFARDGRSRRLERVGALWNRQPA